MSTRKTDVSSNSLNPYWNFHPFSRTIWYRVAALIRQVNIDWVTNSDRLKQHRVNHVKFTRQFWSVSMKNKLILSVYLYLFSQLDAFNCSINFFILWNWLAMYRNVRWVSCSSSTREKSHFQLELAIHVRMHIRIFCEFIGFFSPLRIFKLLQIYRPRVAVVVILQRDGEKSLFTMLTERANFDLNLCIKMPT